MEKYRKSSNSTYDIKYDLANTVEKSHLGHDNGGVSFFPYGFINGGDGQPEKFFSKVKISNK